MTTVSTPSHAEAFAARKSPQRVPGESNLMKPTISSQTKQHNYMAPNKESMLK